MTRKHKEMSAGFVAIILFKLFKGAVFLLFGIATLRLLRSGTLPSASEIAHFFSVDPENQLIRKIAWPESPVAPVIWIVG